MQKCACLSEIRITISKNNINVMSNVKSTINIVMYLMDDLEGIWIKFVLF